MKKSLLSVAVALTLSASAVHAADLMFKPGEDARFSWSSYDALKSTNLSGETISVFGPWMGDEKGNFERVVAYFEKATGAKVNYAGSDSFEQQIVIDAQAGSAPHISVFPQPGLAADLAAKVFITPLNDTVKKAVVSAYAAGQSWVGLCTV